jgi:hypothetical protein
MANDWSHLQRRALRWLARGYTIVQTGERVEFSNGLRLHARTLRSLALAHEVQTPALPLGTFVWPREGERWEWTRTPVDTKRAAREIPTTAYSRSTKEAS